jgi:ribosomal protein L36
MKVRSTLRLMCKACKFVKRDGTVFVLCRANARVRILRIRQFQNIGDVLLPTRHFWGFIFDGPRPLIS